LTFIYAIINNLLSTAFLVNSLPKAGTNLLTKTVDLLPGIRRAKVDLSNRSLISKKDNLNSFEPAVPLGVDWPRMTPVERVKKALAIVKKGQYASAHIPFSYNMASLLNERNMKSLLILRDPRDVVVSHANYVSTTSGHFLYSIYKDLPESERIMKSIIGIKQTDPGDPLLLNIVERIQSILPWIKQSFNYTTKYENLVGELGGGSREAQIREIKNIVRHLGIICNIKHIERVADNLYGGTATFNKGIVGNWRSYFNERHTVTFNNIAGELMGKMGY
jgi:hypothetical protein